MGRKSSAKAQSTEPPQPPPPRSRTPLVVAVLGVVAIGIIAAASWHPAGSASPADTQTATSAPAAPVTYAQPILQSHPQKDLPPLNFPGYPTPRSPELVRAAYTFAAEHPEVLSYVPCFCGCERAGHRGNEDCFVRERSVNGDVIVWDDHGMECAICLDVADRSRKLYAEGTPVKDIRAAIEREFGGHGPTHTPTPPVPEAR
jgi:hypothetical protein